MVREYCAFIILFCSFHFNVKFVYGVPDIEHSLDMINAVLKSVQKFAGRMQKLFNKKDNKDLPGKTTTEKYHGENTSVQIFETTNLYSYFKYNHSSWEDNVMGRFTGIEDTTPTFFSELAVPQQFLKNREIRLNKPIDAVLDTTQLITLVGYKSESHTVLTSDGYLLTMHRILQETETLPQNAVILHHGLYGSSEDWLLLGPGQALPFMLTERGYDVWLLNARGSKYSRGHTSWPTDSHDYWDFSWHEMGAFDLPAIISYISKRTNGASLHFIGHSMGASALLALLSTNPEYNDKFKSAFFLAPLAFMHHAKGPIKMFADMRQKNGKSALKFLGTYDFLPTGEFPKKITNKYCKGTKLLCSNPTLLIANGGRIDTDDNNLMYNVNYRASGGGSAMTILHYVQLVKSKRFQMYDYGTQDNLNKYKQKRPPKYDLGDVTVSISMFTSPADWLSTTSDVLSLIGKLQNINLHRIIRRADFNHMDFIWAKDAPELIFNPLIQTLEHIAFTSKETP